MAMIKCSECGKEVSDKAKTCVHCGNPLKTSKLNISDNSESVVNTAKNLLNNFTLVSLLCIVNIVLMLQSTFKISFSNLTNMFAEELGGKLNTIEFNIFNFSDFFHKIENTLGSGVIDSTYTTIVTILVYATYVIIAGFIISILLSLIKKDKKIIPIICAIGGTIINIAYIVFSFIISNELSSQGLSDFGGFSATIFPYLISVLSILIMIISIRNVIRDGKKINWKKLGLISLIVIVIIVVLIIGINKLLNGGVMNKAMNAAEMTNREDQELNPPNKTQQNSISITNNAKTTEESAYDKLLKGDFIDLSGTYISSQGKRVTLYNDGTIDSDIYNQCTLLSVSTPSENKGVYSWKIDYSEIQPIIVRLYPIGVEAYSDTPELIKTDTSRLRLLFEFIGFGGSETDFYNRNF